MQIISIKKPQQRWLFGGVGFHNSEATMLPMMTEKFRHECVIKTFREVAPTFSRVFAGFADWTKEAMDAFAEYYDQTFRKVGTLLYLVPGRMPFPMDDFNIDDYCENIAVRLAYLINERKCTKIRYFCATNELSAGNTYAYLAKDLPLFKKIQEGLFKAFRRHELDIGLMATDCSGIENFGQIKWATENMDEVTETYCAHLYVGNFKPGDLGMYPYLTDAFAPLVEDAVRKEKRFVLGEYGMQYVPARSLRPMRNDVCYASARPEEDGLAAIALCEMTIAAINVGCLATVLWSMFDYPDPFLRENGDTAEEKALYDIARFSGHGLQIRYNKNGLVRWCDDEQDYSARASLYTMGHMARLFKKGARVLQTECGEDSTLRCAAVTNADGSLSIVLVHWGDCEKTVTVQVEHSICKALRRYDFSADHVPYHAFNDLQPYSEQLEAENNTVTVTLQPRSVTFLTTDYVERTPSPITNVRLEGNQLRWEPCTDEAHCYYRVYAGVNADFEPAAENQVASTVAEYITVADADLHYCVRSVDRYGNV